MRAGKANSATFVRSELANPANIQIDSAVKHSGHGQRVCIAAAADSVFSRIQAISQVVMMHDLVDDICSSASSIPTITLNDEAQMPSSAWVCQVVRRRDRTFGSGRIGSGLPTDRHRRRVRNERRVCAIAASGIAATSVLTTKLAPPTGLRNRPSSLPRQPGRLGSITSTST